MAAVDTYIGYLARFEGNAIILESGKQIVVRTAAGDRTASQKVTHEALETLCDECIPAAAATELMRKGVATFEYTRGPQPVTCAVQRNASTIRFVIMSAAAAAAAAPAPAPTPPAAPAPPTRRGGNTVPPATGRAKTRSKAVDAAAALASKPAPVPVAPPAFEPAPAAAAPPPSVAPAAVAVPPPAAPPRPIAAVGGEPKINALLRAMKDLGASDLHMSCTMPPLIRKDGEMKPIPAFDVLTPPVMMELLLEIAPEKNRKEFEERSDTDFAHAIEGLSRFRANMFRDRHGPGAVFRAIPFTLLTPKQLGLPPKVLELCYLTKGLVVVTGPTGSGKSTTLATLIDYINNNRHDHIITIEDPIEFVHENKKCLVNQREVHVHTRSFKDALRAALREDPDIVLVGEMRDLETIAIAVETAETGHLVFGTLHTTTAPSTIDRIIDQFPADRQSQVRQMLAESLRGVIAQTLCKKIGGGRVAAYEILIGTNPVRNLIRTAKTFQLPSIMQTSKDVGMVTLNDSLLELVKEKKVEPLEAYMKAVAKPELRAALAKLGIQLNVAEDKE